MPGARERAPVLAPGPRNTRGPRVVASAFYLE